LYNLSEFTFGKLLDDSDGIASNLRTYINGFSPRARDIFDKFEFDNEIAKLDENNRLYAIIKDFCRADIDLSPAKLSNFDMGRVFEELVRKFNEQANQEAGDHFTPREVVRLMVNLVFCDEQDVFKKGIYRTVYDPTAGTGGMLSVAEEYIIKQNAEVNLELFGQEYNPESYAICCSDLLIKDEPIDNLIYGDTLGLKNAKIKSNNFTPHDGHPRKQFHYMFANPPFGVEWKLEKDFIDDKYESLGFDGRFGTVQLIDGTQHFQKMKKSLGNKRNELSTEHIAELVRLYGDYQPDGLGDIVKNGQTEQRVCSKIFANREFGFLKITIERPLRLNFQASPARLALLWEQSAFQALATSKKRKDQQVLQLEIAAGESLQQQILTALGNLDGDKLYLSRTAFVKDLERGLKAAGLKLGAAAIEAILAALSESDPTAEICRDKQGNPELDGSLRDTEIVPLPQDIALPIELLKEYRTALITNAVTGKIDVRSH
jgi:hypothetical protein